MDCAPEAAEQEQALMLAEEARLREMLAPARVLWGRYLAGDLPRDSAAEWHDRLAPGGGR